MKMMLNFFKKNNLLTIDLKIHIKMTPFKKKKKSNYALELH